MFSSIFNYRKSRSSSPEGAQDGPSTVRALPASWYTSQEMYELEQRAIFSRKWLMITHKVRLQQTGDRLQYHVAGFTFIICRDQDGNINGFRDACDFDSVKSGYFPIHIHIDCNGFIWVNLDGKEEPEVAWDDDFLGADRQERYNGLNFDDYEFDHTWQMDGPYNWKILADNYNECYHCATTHPDLKALTDLHAYYVEPKHGYIEHYVATKPEQEAKGLRVHPTYFFPSTSMNVSRHFFMLQRFVPQGPTSSVMLYEVYRNRSSPADDFQIVNEMYKRVMSEDKVLCEAAQRNVNAGIFVNGEMHPKMERGPIYFQKLCRDTVTAFHECEVEEKRKIWPARQTLASKANTSFMDQSLAPQQLISQTSQELVAH